MKWDPRSTYNDIDEDEISSPEPLKRRVAFPDSSMHFGFTVVI